VTEQAVDPRRYRETLGHYPTGVVIVTGIADDGEPVGMVVGTFTAVSLSPPLVAFLPRRDSRTFARLRTAGAFCVNVLAATQVWLCRRFTDPEVTDKFHGVAWTPAPSGAPIIDGGIAWIDCDYDAITEGGDHYIVLGRVRDMRVTGDEPPLLFRKGGYGRFAPLAPAEPAAADAVDGVPPHDRTAPPPSVDGQADGRAHSVPRA